VADLIENGYVERARTGRRNTYTVRREAPIALPSRRDVELSDLLEVLLPANRAGARPAPMAVGG
jgi:hypothetical protein